MTLKILKFSFFILLFSYSCSDEAKHTKPEKSTKPESVKTYPDALTKVSKNYKKVPGFICKFGVGITKGGKNVSADGLAYVDKKLNRLKIILKDTLANQVLLDLALTNEIIKLYFYNTSGGVVISGPVNNLNLGRYIANFNLNIMDLIKLIKANSYIITDVHDVEKQDDDKFIFYKIKKDNVIQIIKLNKQNHRINQLGHFVDGKMAFRIAYKNYKEFSDFYFPMKSYFYHKSKNKTNKIVIFISSDINFSPEFDSKYFELNSKYPKARKIYYN